MRKLKKGLAIIPMLVLIALMGQKIAYAGEELHYHCSGDVHFVPILKDEFRAYAYVSCNGAPHGDVDAYNAAIDTCYVNSYVEVYGIFDGYDSDSYSITGSLAFDPGINCWARASVRGAKKAQSTHSGGNCYASGLTGSTIWTK